MRRMVYLLFLIAPFFVTCEEETEEKKDTGLALEFQSLLADKDTLVSGETTVIKATASGYKLTYYWSASSGAILGSGAQVTFASSSCGCGGSRVTCQVKDGYDHYDTKTIIIVVQLDCYIADPFFRNWTRTCIFTMPFIA